MGAAIGSLSKSDADAEVAQHGGLAGDLDEFFREVVNVLAKLLNSPTSPHVVLAEVDAVPGQVRADAARVALRPPVRVDLGVQIEGFDSGRMTLLTG